MPRRPSATAAAPPSQSEIKMLLRVLMNQPENLTCLDCRDKRPSWATLLKPPPEAPFETLGGFCCFQCSAAHRQLGTHVCFVRSTNLDEWKLKELEAMQRGGNKLLNAIFEANLGKSERDTVKLNSRTDMEARALFIQEKYTDRRWYNIARFQVLVRSAVATPVLSKPKLTTRARSTPTSASESTPRSSRDLTPRSSRDMAPRSCRDLTPRSSREMISRSSGDVMITPRLASTFQAPNLDLFGKEVNQVPSLFVQDPNLGSFAEQKKSRRSSIDNTCSFGDSNASLFMEDLARNADTDWWKEAEGSDQFTATTATTGNSSFGGSAGRIFESSVAMVTEDENFFQNLEASTKRREQKMNLSPHDTKIRRNTPRTSMSQSMSSLDEGFASTSSVNRLGAGDRRNLMQTLQRMESKSKLLDEIRDVKPHHDSTSRLKARRASRQDANHDSCPSSMGPYAISPGDRRNLMLTLERMESKSKLMDEIRYDQDGHDSSSRFRSRRTRRKSLDRRGNDTFASPHGRRRRSSSIDPNKSLTVCDLQEAADDNNERRRRRSQSVKRRMSSSGGRTEESDMSEVTKSPKVSRSSGRRIQVVGNDGAVKCDLKDSVHCLKQDGNEQDVTRERGISRNNSSDSGSRSRSRSQSISRRQSRSVRKSSDTSDYDPRAKPDSFRRGRGSSRPPPSQTSQPPRSSSCKNRRPRRRYQRTASQEEPEDFLPLGEIKSLQRSMDPASDHSSSFDSSSNSSSEKPQSFRGRRPVRRTKSNDMEPVGDNQDPRKPRFARSRSVRRSKSMDLS